jgi:phage shock protein A
MSFFSRLSDIISCKLDDLLANAGEPAAAIDGIIAEIEEGRAGASRSVQSATSAEQRLRTELVERQGQAVFWGTKAREELSAGREDGARQSLLRKRETEDLVAGLEQQLAAAASTREHLSTTLRAIEARLAEARRRKGELQTSTITAGNSSKPPRGKEQHADAATIDRSRAAQIEEDLDALRRELRQR